MIIIFPSQQSVWGKMLIFKDIFFRLGWPFDIITTFGSSYQQFLYACILLLASIGSYFISNIFGVPLCYVAWELVNNTCIRGLLLVRAECVRQSNDVDIILGIISLLSSGLSALSRLGLWLADDLKGKPPHWQLGVNSYWSELSASTSLMSYGDGRQT